MYNCRCTQGPCGSSCRCEQKVPPCCPRGYYIYNGQPALRQLYQSAAQALDEICDTYGTSCRRRRLLHLLAKSPEIIMKRRRERMNLPPYSYKGAWENEDMKFFRPSLKDYDTYRKPFQEESESSDSDLSCRNDLRKRSSSSLGSAPFTRRLMQKYGKPKDGRNDSLEEIINKKRVKKPPPPEIDFSVFDKPKKEKPKPVEKSRYDRRKSPSRKHQKEHKSHRTPKTKDDKKKPKTPSPSSSSSSLSDSDLMKQIQMYKKNSPPKGDSLTVFPPLEAKVILEDEVDEQPEPMTLFSPMDIVTTPIGVPGSEDVLSPLTKSPTTSSTSESSTKKTSSPSKNKSSSSSHNEKKPEEQEPEAEEEKKPSSTSHKSSSSSKSDKVVKQASDPEPEPEEEDPKIEDKEPGKSSYSYYTYSSSSEIEIKRIVRREVKEGSSSYYYTYSSSSSPTVADPDPAETAEPSFSFVKRSFSSIDDDTAEVKRDSED